MENLDLLGDPIPKNFGKRGRPSHIPTQKNRNKVRILLGLDWVDRQIAAALRITKATLDKHYFRELRDRNEARPALKAAHITRIYDAAQGGNVGAMKEFGRIIDKSDLARPQPPAPKVVKLGKKAAAELAAREPDDGGWADLVPPPDEPIH